MRTLPTSMAYLFFFLIFLTAPAMAQISMDNGVRVPQAMMVSGNSVIDDKNSKNKESKDEETADDLPVADMLFDDVDTLGTDDAVVPEMPIDPFVPAPEPVIKPNIQQQLKKLPVVRVQRSISDDRIDDGYVQGLIRNNSTFTPDID